MSPVYVAGVGVTPFGRHLERPVHELARVTQGLLQGQVAIPGHVVFSKISIHSIPIYNVESACASGRRRQDTSTRDSMPPEMLRALKPFCCRMRVA